MNIRNTKTWLTILILGGEVTLSSFIPSSIQAAGKKKPAAAPVAAQPTLGAGKKVVALIPLQPIKIQMPDQGWRNFGEEFHAILSRKLIQTGRYVLAEDAIKSSEQGLQLSDRYANPVWPSSEVPAATVRVSVSALSFVTGARGDRMFYGFDERFKTPFNDGTSSLPNEFPLKQLSFEPNWFDRQFDAKGTAPFDSQTGLDLGQGFDLNVLFAWLSVKHAKYQSELHLNIDVDAPLAGRESVRHRVVVSGKGYFYDVSGAYAGFSLGIQYARTDAMTQAITRAIESTMTVIDADLKDLPLTARVDGIANDTGLLYLGTGRFSEVAVGTVYQILSVEGSKAQIIQTAASGSVAKLIEGDLAAIQPGMLMRQDLPGLPRSAVKSLAQRSLASQDVGWWGLVQDHSIQLPGVTIEKPAFPAGSVPQESKSQAIWKSITETVLLAYRIYRYHQYDRPYAARPDFEVGSDSDPMGEGWGTQIGLDMAPPMPDLGANAPVVAVIGSGVDYNHPAIHQQLWLNPSAQPDARGLVDRYGWDFISGDAHPMDDAYPGTQVASLVTAVAPQSRIMALKAVNPWGITTSAAIYASFEYAVDHGAKIILCPWATRLSTRAVELGVKYAQDHDVVVVAAAGDRGDPISRVAAYPAALSGKFNNVLSVTSVDSQDQLVQVSGLFANYDSQLVQIAAPGQNLRVAEPRGRWKRDTSTRLSAAIVAGALALRQSEQPSRSILDIKQDVLNDADRLPGLSPWIQEGRRLRIR